MALAHLDEHGTHIEGVDEVRAWLQSLMDQAIEALDGTHFELAERVRKVESRIAPPGSAAAPYYTAPSEDFSRPGRTWLPTMGQTRFPVYDLVSTWYHEGVPGHHLQLAQWAHVAENLSRYQATVGGVSANAEGWALYAERLMDELGLPHGRGAAARLPRRADDARGPGHRRHRHAPGTGDPGGLALPPGRALDARAGAGVLRRAQQPPGGLRGERADPLPRRSPARPSATSSASAPGCWAARTRRSGHGDAFDAKAWHMAALSQGSLGLDDLVDELSQL